MKGWKRFSWVLVTFCLLLDLRVYAGHDYSFELYRKQAEQNVTSKIRKKKALYYVASAAAVVGTALVFSSVSFAMDRIGFSIEKLTLKNGSSNQGFYPYLKKGVGASLFTGAVYVGKRLGEKLTNKGLDKLEKDVTGVFFRNPFDSYFEYEIANEMNKLLLSDDLLDIDTYRYIEKNLAHVKLVQSSLWSDNQFAQTQIKNILEGIKCIFNLPKALKRLKPSSDIKNKLDELIAPYDLQFQEKMDRTVLEIIDNSQLELNKGFKPRKMINYFLGEPGTGKTFLANNLANLLDIPFVEIRLGEAENATQIFGRSVDMMGMGAPLQSFDKLSDFSTALLNAKNLSGKKYSNAIILIDEADRLLNGTADDGGYGISALQNIMLKLLDPDRSKVMLQDLGLNVDISHCIFILTGNTPLRDKAILDRVRVFQFPDISKDKKESIAVGKLHEIGKARGLEITKTEEQLIGHFLESDQSGGVRPVLQEVDSIISGLLSKKLKWE